MKKYLFSCALWSVALCIGCYDLTFDPVDHVVDEFTLMAIHVDPPEIRPDTPIQASVLYYDPRNATRDIFIVWRITSSDSYWTDTTDVQIYFDTAADGGDSVTIPAVATQGTDNEDAPFVDIEVYLCAGRLKHPEQLETLSSQSLFTDLCVDGPLLTGYKGIDYWDADFPSNNPLIDDVFADDTLLISSDQSKINQLCTEETECEVSRLLALYLDESSLEQYSLVEPGETDAGLLADGGLIDNTEFSSSEVRLQESFWIDWYVSGGTLLYPYDASDDVGPYTTQWTPPREVAYLWTIARDNRGGNQFRTFIVR